MFCWVDCEGWVPKFPVTQCLSNQYLFPVSLALVTISCSALSATGAVFRRFPIAVIGTMAWLSWTTITTSHKPKTFILLSRMERVELNQLPTQRIIIAVPLVFGLQQDSPQSSKWRTAAMEKREVHLWRLQEISTSCLFASALDSGLSRFEKCVVHSMSGPSNLLSVFQVCSCTDRLARRR